ncbi:uncharacterized protein IL334_000748 [Kwoniella shivajii]|uniref:Vacuolar ATPase assembly integral membrane protein VMA21 n=1 Tax=Kwoniella shivajii TaxID=564305 RepID=A0ABZ1CQH3_9TREE|nr:hypothetical protein IL334_000748 [Kwoniella shivajii]
MVNPVSTGKMASVSAENDQPAVLLKLIIFAVSMAVAPIGTYFLVLNQFTQGNTIASAISAIVAANIILVAYIVVAMIEDRSFPTTSNKPVTEVKKNK